MKFNREDLRSLNRRVRGLPRILRRNRDKARLEDVEVEDRDDLHQCNEMVRVILREVCSGQTTDAELAVTAAIQTRTEFFDRLSRAAEGSVLDWVMTECLVLLFPPNVWLFVHARQALDKLEKSLAPMTPGSADYGRDLAASSPPPTKPAGTLPTPRVEVADKHCPLRGLHERRKNDPDGQRWTTRQAFRRDYCRRDCILMLLDELGFKVREMESAMGVTRAIVSDRLEDCTRKVQSLLGARTAPAPAAAKAPTQKA